jgi:hypothetical protein
MTMTNNEMNIDKIKTENMKADEMRPTRRQQDDNKMMMR